LCSGQRAVGPLAGRVRGIDAEAERLRTVFRSEYLHQLPLVEDAFGRQALALLRQIDAACATYAGSAPVTRANGKSLAVMHRRAKNQRLAVVGYVWAFAALTASPGAGTHYDRRKAAATATPVLLQEEFSIQISFSIIFWAFSMC
jgi:hypothetical protein